MNVRFLRAGALLLVIAVMLSLVVACGQNAADGDNRAETSAGTAGGQTTAQTAAADNNEIYPLKTQTVLDYWVALDAKVADGSGEMNKTKFAAELYSKTGVKVNYIHPPRGQEAEAFNILIASGDFPDLIESNWSTFPGGPEKAVADNVIMKLNDVVDQYAPNLKAYYEANPDIYKMCKTDTGSQYVFPFIRGDESLLVATGPIIRKDWLDELNLAVPETIDDWYGVLKAFKDKKNATAPLSFSLGLLNDGYFVGAYGVTRSFFTEDNSVKYGPIQSAYKDFLTTMRLWYQEGLLDKNIPTLDATILNANILGGNTGATVHNTGGGIGNWMTAMKDKDPGFVLAAAPNVVLNKGEKPKFGGYNFNYPGVLSVAISTGCKDVETAARFLDYGYSEEGRMLYNFGIENESYQMENGFPTFREVILNNADNLPVSVAMSMYCRNSIGGPFIQDFRAAQQTYVFPQQAESVTVWSNSDAAKYKLPPITFTPEESQVVARLMSDITTYESEMFLKFLTGVESIDKFDQYVDKIKAMKIDEALALYQAALDRYNNR